MNTNLLPVPTFGTAPFTRHGDTLVAYASDIGFHGAGRMYRDAIDRGIALRSHRTGTVERFCLASADSDGEGEVTGWRFIPAPENRTARAIRVLIIND